MPDEIKAKYYGCGSPFPRGIKGLRVLDLGCGSGRDCYVCASLVGEEGSVIGEHLLLVLLLLLLLLLDVAASSTPWSACRSVPQLDGTRCVWHWLAAVS